MFCAESDVSNHKASPTHRLYLLHAMLLPPTLGFSSQQFSSQQGRLNCKVDIIQSIRISAEKTSIYTV